MASIEHATVCDGCLMINPFQPTCPTASIEHWMLIQWLVSQILGFQPACRTASIEHSEPCQQDLDPDQVSTRLSHGLY